MRWGLIFLWILAPLSAAELTFSIEPRWQGAPLSVPSLQPLTSGGLLIRLTRVSVLLSGATLLRADGGTIRLDGQYGFVDAETRRLDWTLSGVPEGDYVGAEFLIGVPEAVNHADPGRWPAGHALNPLVNALHWNWQGGYVFCAIEGRWQPAAERDEAKPPESGFSYHIAGDARRMAVRFKSNFSVRRKTKVGLALELSRILEATHLGEEPGSESTHSANGDALATRLAVSVERGWFWLEAKEQAASVETSRVSVKTVAPRHDAMAFVVPPGFPQPDFPADNPLTRAGVTLGRRLFRDRRLSGNGSQSCATCHDPAHAFSDRVALSRGADGEEGRRNSMPLSNLAWSPAYAWDGSQPRIRDQALAAMTNPREMHADAAKVQRELERDEVVRGDFAAAFGTPEISPERIGLALEQYLLTLVSADAKFDRVTAGRDHFTAQEQRGFELFLMEYDPARGRRGADCFHCHGGMLFTDFGYKNNGLEVRGDDHGRGIVTKQRFDEGKFKTPSLRNLALTAPYMHDGRFATLKDVVAHYDHGVARSATLDPNLAKHPAEGLALTEEDQNALVAFLMTLTDNRWLPSMEVAAK